jgi:hypothetical protein
MTGDVATRQAEYVALGESRPSDDSQPAIVALPVPKPYGRGGFGALKASGKAIEASLPDAIGAYIAWLTEHSGWMVSEKQTDGTEERVKLQARHIAVLFRRFVSFGEDVTRPYVDAIEARGIPHLLVGGKAFHGREEVETSRAALAAIEWPDDELSVFASLKGSLSRSTTSTCSSSATASARSIRSACLGARWQQRPGSALTGSRPRTCADRRRPPPAAAAAPRAQLPSVADTIGRPPAETRAHVGFISGRPASRRSPTSSTSPSSRAVRGRRRDCSGGFIDS